MGEQKYKFCFGKNNKLYVGEGKRRAITLKEKLEVLKRFERNERTCDIVRATGIKESTLRTIRDNAEKIKASIHAGTSLSASKVLRIRPKLIEEMEQILHVWIENQKKSPSEISFLDVKHMALSIYSGLRKKYGNSTDMSPFSASTTWFAGFRNRYKFRDLSTGKQISKTSQPQPVMETTLKPREVLPNMETELPEEIDFESSQIETINTIKEEFQDDQSDSNVPMMINESQLSDVTQQEADSIIMDAYEPSSKRFLVIPEYQNRMMLSLASMWKQQKMCDASIGNGTTIIKVHKVVLLATSPTLLSNSEVRDDCFLRVNFPANISENAMRAFAEYMYNGVLDLDPLTLTQLQQISYQLGIEELCLLCNTHLYSQTQDAENIIQPGTSLSHLATQSDTSSSQISLNHKQSSSPGVKNSSLVQSSKGQNFILPNPFAVKIESQDSIQDYSSMGPAFPTHSEITTNVAVSVNEPVYSPRSISVAKVSKIPKTFQECSQTLESPVVSQIKREHLNQNVFEYDQHCSTLSSTCTSSHPPRLSPRPSPAIDTTSNHQQSFSKNQLKAVTTLSTLPSSSGDKAARPTRENASLRTIAGNNDLRLNLRNKPSQSQKSYSTMLLSSELDTLPQNISQTAKREPYIDLTS